LQLIARAVRVKEAVWAPPWETARRSA
jgi:hypothetical protein